MKKLLTTLTAATFALSLSACDVDQTEEGGNLPEYDVEGPDVDVGTEEVTVDVPTVDIDGPADAEGEPVTGDE